jgi:diaminopimelate epimerase
MDRWTAEGSPGLRFLKMHGLGNDFVIIDARGPSDPVTLATVSSALSFQLGARSAEPGCQHVAAMRVQPMRSIVDHRQRCIPIT